MRNKILFGIIIISILVVVLMGCTTTTPQDIEPEAEPTVVKISVDETTIPSVAYAGYFDVSSLLLNVTYSDGSVKSVGVNINMVGAASRAKLEQVGTQTIELIYANCSTKFQISLKEKAKQKFTLRVYGGQPIAINDVAIDEEIELIEDSKTHEIYFEGVYEEGTVVTLEWIPEAEKSFNLWTDDNNSLFKDTQSITKATMNMDHIYRATSSAAIMTVNFVTNCDVLIGSQKTNVLYTNAIPTLTKEGYVFDGWTLQKLIGDEAIDSDAEKIVFPYNVTLNNITLYGLWRRLGLEYISYTNETTGNTGYKVTSYEKNDTELTIPATYDGFKVIAIDADAFKEATKLEKLSLPATIEEIGDGFVRNCTRLKAIDLAIGSRYFTVNDGVLYNILQDELIAYPAGKISAVVSLSGVKVIRDYALYNSVVGGIELSSSLVTIGDCAFSSVHIDYVDFVSVNPFEMTFGADLCNDNISHIIMSGAYIDSAYWNSTSLYKFKNRFTTSTDNIPVIGIDNTGSILYKEIVNEDSESISTTVEIIGVDRSLVSFAIPSTLGNNRNVSSIGAGAFNGCIYLSSVTFQPEGKNKMERILDGAFDGTPYLENLKTKAIIENGILYKYYGLDSVYVVPANVTRIAERAFYNNDTLVRLDLRKATQLKYIGAYAFYNCSALIGTVDDTERGFYTRKDLVTIGNYAFAYSAITAFGVQTGTALSAIGKEAFSHCYYLTNVAIGTETEDIDITAFLFSYALEAFEVKGENPSFVAIDGVLYKSEGEEIDTLFMYPAGRMMSVFDVAENTALYSGEKDINIRLISEYAFFMSDIGALSLPATITSINSNSIFIPGLVYIKFAQINDGMTYDAIFNQGAEEYEKYAPEYIVAPSDDRNLDNFFGRDSGDNATKEKLYRETENTEFVVLDNKLILKIVGNNLNGYASVIKSARNATEMEIPESVESNGYTYLITTIGGYAFMGSYLNKLTFGRRIDVLEDYSLKYLPNLSELYFAPDGGIPQINENSFGETFDNGMFVYIAQNKINILQIEWQMSSTKYIIDIALGKATASFGYKAGEEAIEGTGPMETVTGEITQEWINNNIPLRDGYTFEGWVDDNDNLIDFSDPYIIPYNITLVCKWKTFTYTVILNLEGKALLDGERVLNVDYGSLCDFGIPVYSDGSKKFLYWYMADGTHVESNTMWSYSDKGDVVNLYPEWEVKQFVLNYDISVGEITYKEVLYDSMYTLDVPTKDGFIFKGWAMDADGNEMLTNAEGRSFLSWEYTDSDQYTIYSIWEAKEITVSLYFDSNTLFKQVSQVYGQEFSFPYSGISNEQWAKKAELFCGWYDTYDSENASGTGKKYTDETGAGLFNWDISTEINLYAQWPLEISTGAELENLTDLTRSVILISDITINKPIGDAETPYSGTFIGNGHIVFFDYIVDSETVFDGYVGVFARNSGTIKNIKIVTNIEITGTDKLIGNEMYIGAIAGLNEGKIINNTVEGADVTASIKIATTTDVTAYIGGYLGYNKQGSIKNVSINLIELSVSVNGVAFDKVAHSEKIICGLVVGCVEGGSIGTSADDPDKNNINESFVYYYSNTNDPFKNTNCGLNKTGTAINIAVSSSLQ